MRLINLSVSGFLQEVDSPTPAPGGGSVSALAIAQGISLIRMVAHLTISKKKFQSLEESVKADYLQKMVALETLKNRVFELIDLDTEAFNQIMAAFKLNKNTEDEIRIRNQTIDEATLQATEVPKETASIAVQALELSYPMFAYANRQATSDFGVGIQMIFAGLNGAILNVKTNMVGYPDENVRRKYLDTVSSYEKIARELTDKAMEAVHSVLN